MEVICFASLKGGVGKTSTAINVAHAFAERECRVLLVDLDPAGHACRSFRAPEDTAPDPAAPRSGDLSLLFESNVAVARDRLHVLNGEAVLKQSVSEKGELKRIFRLLVEQIGRDFDYIIFDTPPVLNSLTKNAIRISDLVVVPVDSSAMAVRSLEELVTRAAGLGRPAWTVLRTMISRQAVRVRRLAEARLGKNLKFQAADREARQSAEENLDDPAHFLAFLEQNLPACAPQPGAQDESPVFLLDSVIYRSELYNRLSFQGRTVFDAGEAQHLARQYGALSRELEHLLALGHHEEPEMAAFDFLPANWQ